jgi:hypothetical protein
VKYLVRVAVGLVLLCSADTAGPQDRGQPDTKRTPVLVELFTSEGCSSCPPADEFLARLNREQPLSGIIVIGIEEHVDYWNHQGWIDPYSSAEWTSRQVSYVDRLKENTAYTPQVVIDGQRSIVGVREREILQSIQESARQPRAEIEANLETPAADGALKLHVRAGKLESASNDSAEIWLAIAERDLDSKVNDGENAGKELRHSSVLRSLKKLGVASAKGNPAFEGSTQVKLSREWKSQNIEAIVFAQEKKSKQVLGIAVARPAGE